MPPSRAPRSPTPNQAFADRATALRYAGVRRSCTRNQVRDTLISANSNDGLEDAVNRDDATNHDQPTDEAETQVSHESLPAGCVMGIPVPLGRPVTRLPPRSDTIDLAIMRSIQSDNYKFIRHMIIQGWTPVSPAACSFAVKINRPDQEQEVWQVREATPVHYAVCCGSLEAAAGLVVAFPELAFASCEVEAGGGADSMGRRSRWTALEFASFFGSLYVGVDSGRHGAYQEASLVLLHLKEHPRRLPFMQHHTPALRLAAAPKRPHDLLAVIRAVVS